MTRVMKRKLDEMGRIIVPVDLREEFKFGTKEKFNLQCIGNEVFLRKMSENQEDGYNDIQLDEMGRIRMPKELLDALGWKPKDVIGIYIVDEFTIGFKAE